MIAVILSAGRGIRLKPLSDTMPKALIPVGGSTLIEYSLAAIASAGIKETIIVIGYLGDQIKKVVGDSFCGMTIKYAANEEYLSTGTMYSFSKAQTYVDDDIMLLEADLIYEPSIIKKCLDSKQKNLVVVSGLCEKGDEVLVASEDAMTILAIGKKIAKINICGEFIGISKLSKAYCKSFFTFVSENYFSKDILSGYYEDYFVSFGKHCCVPMSYLLIDNSLWAEIDDAAGLARVKNIIYPNLKKYLKNEKN